MVLVNRSTACASYILYRVKCLSVKDTKISQMNLTTAVMKIY